MKKKAINTILLFFLTAVASAQIVTTDTAELIGLNYITGKEIYARKYEFKNLIYDSQVDTTFNTLTLQLRDVKSNGKQYKNTGQLAVFDLVSKKIMWSIDRNYFNTEVEQYDDVLFYKTGISSTSRLQLTTGNTLWNSKIVVFVTIPNLNIGLGYKYNSFTQQLSNNLSCIDLNTGAVRWEKQIDRSYGWDGVENINDTALIIKSSGLHFVDLKNGQGWDYETKTGVKDYSKTIGANVAGALLGILTGSFVVTTGHDLVSNLVSNVISDSAYIYFASKEYITCLTHTGKVIWRTELPKETSHSNIMMDSTKVYLINDGEALYNGRKYVYGKPYFAAYNKLTGEEHYLSILDFDKNPLLELISGEDSVELLFKDKSVQYSLQTGIAKTITYNPEQIGSFEYVIDRFKVHIKTDSVIQSIHNYDPRAFYLKSSNGKVIKLDQSLNFQKTIEMNDLCVSKARNKKYTFINYDNKTLVVNQQNKAIAELNMGKRLFIYKNCLYGIDKNALSEIDLDKTFN